MSRNFVKVRRDGWGAWFWYCLKCSRQLDAPNHIIALETARTHALSCGRPMIYRGDPRMEERL